MKFTDFLNLVPKIAKEMLPGEDAHIKMSPPERMAILKTLDIQKMNLRQAGVMMLVYPIGTEANLALILRNSYNGVHSSQIAFPGGKAESYDASFEQTALRETHEEVGVAPDQITVVREFSNVYIPPSNFMVFPFLGYCDVEPTFIPDPAEVAGMIAFPLAEFLDDRIVVNRQMATSYSKSIEVPTFKIGDQYVWGATAMILSELKEVLNSVR